jgi:hypothetical protein
MSAFLTELGRKIAERWVSLLVLPGMLFVAAATAGSIVGQAGWYDFALLRRQLVLPAADPALRTPTAAVLIVAAVLACSAVAGLTAQLLGRIVERIWLGEWPRFVRWLGRPLIALRRRRWNRAALRHQEALELKARLISAGADTAELPDTAALNAVRNRIALTSPRRPTWIGDRVLAVDARVHTAYDLDLASAWPRLWLILPDAARTELSTARQRFDDAARFAGWGLLYVVLAIVWWPAAVVGAITVASAAVRGRAAIETYTELVESAVDLHGRALAASLDIPCDDGLTKEVGFAVTGRLRKGS